MHQISACKTDLTAQLDRASQCHRSDDLDGAEAHYRLILKDHPGHAGVLHLLGVLACQRKRYTDAVQLIGQAISKNDANPDFYSDIGVALASAGELERAREAYLSALKLNPGCVNAAFNMGNLCLRQGSPEEAVRYYRQAIAAKADFWRAYANLSAALNQQGEYLQALACCHEGLRHAPDDPELLINMANALHGAGESEKAVAVLQRIIYSYPASAVALVNMGNILHDLGRTDQAIDCYRRALQIDPDNTEYLNDLGVIYTHLGLWDRAKVCYRAAIRLRPEEARPNHNLGNICLDREQYAAAEHFFSRAVSVDPEFSEAYVGLGIALQQSGRLSEAVACFKQAADLDSKSAEPCCYLVRSLQHACRWKELEHFSVILDNLTAAALEKYRKPDEAPFLHLTRHRDPVANYRVAKAWSDQLEKRIRSGREKLCAAVGRPYTGTPKITLGYLSNNFKNHPTAHLIEGLFELHGRTRFNVHCYSYGIDDGSTYRRTIVSACDRFVDLRADSHLQAARRIRSDGVDILIDLVGFMKGHRMEIAALRPSPVQVRWMGMAGTCGADFFDYIITDHHVTPEEEAGCYAETFAFMPHTYQFNRHPAIGPAQFGKPDFNLPEKGFIFACFCSTYKIDRTIYAAWMDILTQVPGSVLWLLSPGAAAENRLKARARLSGVDPARIVFAEKVDRSLHLSRLRRADLCLDTMSVNGALTTSEALWAGVPVISMHGRHFASRMGASMLNALEMPELITAGLDDYIHLAVQLGRKPNFYRRMRRKLEEKRATAPLFDSHAFVHNLEDLFQQMWRCHRRGEAKKMIYAGEQSDGMGINLLFEG